MGASPCGYIMRVIVAHGALGKNLIDGREGGMSKGRVCVCSGKQEASLGRSGRGADLLLLPLIFFTVTNGFQVHDDAIIITKTL